MKKIISLILVLSLFLLNLNVCVFAAGNKVDEFYNSLPKSEYKEYAHAKASIREIVLGKDLDKASLGLGKYAFDGLKKGFLPDNQEFYYFASAIEDEHTIIKKYAIYDLNGKRIATGINRHAKKESVLNNKFKGWEKPVGENELSNKRE